MIEEIQKGGMICEESSKKAERERRKIEKKVIGSTQEV